MAVQSVTISCAVLELGVLHKTNMTITVIQQYLTQFVKPCRINIGFYNYAFTITDQARCKLVEIFMPEFQQNSCCKRQSCVLKKKIKY